MRCLLVCTLGLLVGTTASASVFDAAISIDYINSSACGGRCPFNVSNYGWAGVNDSNEVATSYQTNGTGPYYGYTYLNGAYSTPFQNGTHQSGLSGIDDAGTMSGMFNNGLFRGMTGTPGSFSTVAMPAGTAFTDGYPNPFSTAASIGGTFLNGIELTNSNPVEVGFFASYNSNYPTVGLVYNPGNSSQPYSPVVCANGGSNAYTTNAYSINDSGMVVGFCKLTSGSSQQGFVYDYGTTPNTAPALLSSTMLANAFTAGGNTDTVTAVFLTAIDDNGDIAGYYQGTAVSGLTNRGFYCPNAVNSSGAFALSTCQQYDFPQASAYTSGLTISSTYIYALNNVGSVVGAYAQSDGLHTFLAETTPEPGTLLLSAASLIGVIAFRLRRNRIRG